MTEEQTENFGTRLRQLRKSRGWTMQEIADRLDTTKASISGYEQHDRMPTPDKIIIFAKLFGVSVDYILGQTDDPTPHSKLADAKTYLSGIRQITWDGIELTDDDLRLAIDFFKVLAQKNINNANK